jgi:hypothetical protein
VLDGRDRSGVRASAIVIRVVQWDSATRICGILETFNG